MIIILIIILALTIINRNIIIISNNNNVHRVTRDSVNRAIRLSFLIIIHYIFLFFFHVIWYIGIILKRQSVDQSYHSVIMVRGQSFVINQIISIRRNNFFFLLETYLPGCADNVHLPIHIYVCTIITGFIDETVV